MTRSGAGTGADQNANNTNNTINTSSAHQPPPHPPLTMEQLMAMQTHLMQGMAHMIANMNQNQGGNHMPAPPRDKYGEFMKERPPFFSYTTDLMQADDWLKSMEK
jgi:hypothetical protein